jgi:membrane protein
MARPRGLGSSGRLARAVIAAVPAYSRVAGGQQAAAISYRVLFSLVPFAALLVSVIELVLPEATGDRVLSWLVGALTLPEGLAERVEAAVDRSRPPATAAGAVALALLVWTASGMMASIRIAFRAVWATDAGRPYLRGKLLDVFLVLGAGLLVICGFGASVVVQVVTETSTEVVRDLGQEGSATERLGSLGQLGLSVGLVAAAFVLLYRVVPPEPPRTLDVLPGAALAAVAFEVASAGFSIYLDRFADFDRVYGPLGAVLAFLVLVYVTASILVLGACVVAAWQRTSVRRLPGPEVPSGRAPA